MNNPPKKYTYFFRKNDTGEQRAINSAKIKALNVLNSASASKEDKKKAGVTYEALQKLDPFNGPFLQNQQLEEDIGNPKTPQLE